MHLLFSGLAVGRHHSSFPFAVHLGRCRDTFSHLSKKAIRKSYYLHSYPLSVVFLSLSPAFLSLCSGFFFFYIPNIAHKSGRLSVWGELETVHWWSFFFFNRCSWILLTPPLFSDGGGFLKRQRLTFSLHFAPSSSLSSHRPLKLGLAFSLSS